MSVGRLCSRVVHVAGADEGVAEVARRMRDANVGCVVVVDGRRRPVGLLTDRDLVLRVLADGHAFEGVRVDQVMTPEPAVVPEDAVIEDAIALMRRRRARRLPVVDEAGVLAGLLTADDVLALLAQELGAIGSLIEGQGPPGPLG